MKVKKRYVHLTFSHYIRFASNIVIIVVHMNPTYKFSICLCIWTNEQFKLYLHELKTIVHVSAMDGFRNWILEGEIYITRMTIKN